MSDVTDVTLDSTGTSTGTVAATGTAGAKRGKPKLPVFANPVGPDGRLVKFVPVVNADGTKNYIPAGWTMDKFAVLKRTAFSSKPDWANYMGDVYQLRVAHYRQIAAGVIVESPEKTTAKIDKTVEKLVAYYASLKSSGADLTEMNKKITALSEVFPELKTLLPAAA